ncbi:hypothetical protein DXG03_002843 [Asterophora parasitica]|uniref:Uncharacterized protein n=1 Tax=Asterophora parasitica TaxID=117018 RepID=A0A9P7G7X5_9AGAR|nr:hypothetical protein DXG03_002843 [Asterophora parasitica]
MGHPDDMKADEWFEAARSQDFLLCSEDDFAHHVALAPARPACGGVAPAPPLWWHPPIPLFTMSHAAPQPPLHVPPLAAAPPPAPHSLPMGIPMDIDASQMHVATMEDICQWCQKKGHFA